MADGLVIQIGADVSGALQNIPKVGKSLAQVETQFASLIDKGEDFGKAIDELAKDGALSINFLQKQMNDFRDAMANATNPDDIVKFGAALQILKIKQQQLINSGLPEHIDQISHSAGSGTVATQRLSSSILGLSNHIGVLPPELQGLAHGFDQLIQSFESITHGTDSAGDKVSKFAGVLGQVGLGLAISVAIGLLVDFVKELFSTDAALEQVTQRGSEMALAFDKINKSVSDNKEALGFIQSLSDTFANVRLGSGFDTDLVKLQGHLATLKEGFTKLGTSLTSATQLFESEFGRMLGNVSEETADIIRKFGTLSNIPEAVIKNLPDVDKGLIENAQKAFEKRLKSQEDFNKNFEEQLNVEAQIRELRANKEREDNKKLQALLDSRAAIIDEFTKKFAAIKDPFPKFLSDNLPLGKVNDKLLRAGLESTFKLFDDAFRDLADIHKVNPATIPVEIKFKPEIVGKTDLVRQIEESFGDLNKDVQSAINKGIFEVPVEFKVAPEGNGKALKELEDRFLQLGKDVEQFTGQHKAILNFNFDINKLDTSKVEDLVKSVQDEVQRFASGTPLKVSIDANFQVHAKVDLDRLAQDLNRQVNDILVDTLTNIAVTVGESIGNILSNTGTLEDGFRAIFVVIGSGLEKLGAALIKTGLLATGIKTALDKLAISPALSIALGVAMVALGKALSNSFQAREKGGPVAGGQPYLVNEKGQEAFRSNTGAIEMIPGGMQMFRPKVSGTIIPASLAKTIANQFKIPKLAGGGIVNTPTFALIGESGPEFVAPISQLPALIGGNQPQQNNRLTTKLRGKDIYLSQSRQGRSNIRLV